MVSRHVSILRTSFVKMDKTHGGVDGTKVGEAFRNPPYRLFRVWEYNVNLRPWQITFP